MYERNSYETYFANQWILHIEYNIIMKVFPLENGFNWSAIAQYHVGIPVVFAFRPILHEEKNSRMVSLSLV